MGKRGVDNDYKVCNLSDGKNGIAIFWEYGHAGGKNLSRPPGNHRASCKDKVKNSNSDCPKQKSGLFPPILLCPLQYVVEVRVGSSVWSIKTDFKKGVVSEQGMEQGDHRAVLIWTIARAKVRGPDGVCCVFWCAHKLQTSYTVGEKPKRIYHVTEDTECHAWELKFNYLGNEKLLRNKKRDGLNYVLRR